MNIFVLTIFPEIFSSFWKYGIVRKAIDQKIIHPITFNIRDFADTRHKLTDDTPYGGGCGMVMKPEPLAKAIRTIKADDPLIHTILLTPQGHVLNQKIANKLSQVRSVLFICGRYEGIDERIYNEFVDDEISIGDYILTGGELAAMVVIDAFVRLLPGAVGNIDSIENDTFSNGLLKFAQYTRPYDFEGQEVPKILLSGNHKEIKKFRIENALIRTFLKRPELLEKRPLNHEEITILKHWCHGLEKLICSQSSYGTHALSSDQQEG